METRVCRLHGRNDVRVETAPIAAPGPGEILVAVGAGGVCGSDLHYYQDGGFGPIRVREPIILGHEAAGTVVARGPGVDGPAPGAIVAINPSRPCGECDFCAAGLHQHCRTMRFNGSAMRFPHEQGLFRDHIVVDAARCVLVGPDASVAEAACAEPLSVALHARARAGALSGRRVLVTGSGPIGALCVGVAAEAGAAEIIATDLHDPPLNAARAMGATRVLNAVRDAAAIEDLGADKGSVDVVFECTAAAPAIRAAIAALRPQGIFVQVGVAGDVPLPLNLIVGKEITLRGSHRFHAEFAEAARLIATRRIDARPIISHSFPLEQAAEAFATAADRRRAVKVQITFASAA